MHTEHISDMFISSCLESQMMMMMMMMVQRGGVLGLFCTSQENQADR